MSSMSSCFSSVKPVDVDNDEDFDDDKDKRKCRNLSEKKRRHQFNCLISELCTIINYEPNSPTINSAIAHENRIKKMDKSSILRSAITFLRNNNSKRESKARQNSILDTNDEQLSYESIYSWKPSFLVNDEFVYLLLEALDAFVIIIEANVSARVVYISETIIPLLGIIGSHLNFDANKIANSDSGLNIYDLIHNDERNLMEKFIEKKSSDPFVESFVSIFLHFKDFTSNSESHNSHQLVRLMGSFYYMNDFDDEDMTGGEQYFIAIARLLTPKLLRELSIDSILINDKEFISRHSLEWKILYMDYRATPIIGYMPFEILGTSGYDYYHWQDLDQIVLSHEHLMKAGEAVSAPYRFLTKSQQWVWIKTRYQINFNQWNSKPEFVVCTHTLAKESNKFEDNVFKSIIKNCDITSNPNAFAFELQPQQQQSSSSGTSLSSLASSKDSNSSSNLNGLMHIPVSLSNNSISSISRNDFDTSSLFCNSGNSQLHDYLQNRQRQLQYQIQHQQEELRRLSEQLVMVQSSNTNLTQDYNQRVDQN